MVKDHSNSEHWLEREIARWVHPMKDRSNDPSHHERTFLPRSYISLLTEENCDIFNVCSYNHTDIRLRFMHAIMDTQLA